jgi:subtilisin family serine protease
MKAMEQAYLDGMDVINLSLGDTGWPESPASLLADELALKGMIVCAAAGNEGEKGIFEVGSPSLGKHAFSIASVDNTHVFSHSIKLENDLTLGKTMKMLSIGNNIIHTLYRIHDIGWKPVQFFKRTSDSGIQ